MHFKKKHFSLIKAEIEYDSDKIYSFNGFNEAPEPGILDVSKKKVADSFLTKIIKIEGNLIHKGKPSIWSEALRTRIFERKIFKHTKIRKQSKILTNCNL